METSEQELDEEFVITVGGKRYGPVLDVIAGAAPPDPRAWYMHDNACELCDGSTGPLHQHHVHRVAQHSSKSQEHYTPLDYIAAEIEVMGGIDLDPASNHVMAPHIGASAWFGYGEDGTLSDGLSVPWHGRVHLNPPGGLTSRARPDLEHVHRSYPMIWWAKLLAEYMAGRVTEAIFIAFKLEFLSMSQTPIIAGAPSMLDFPVCIPSSRVRYLFPTNTNNGRPTPGSKPVASKQPTHASATVYLPPREWTDVDKFEKTFSKFGKIIMPNDPWHPRSP